MATKTKRKPASRRPASLDKRKAKFGWLFVAPFVIGFIVIYLPIIINSIIFSFSEFETIAAIDGGGYILHNVGFDNYKNALFVDTEFVKVLTTGIRQLLLEVPAIVIFSLFLAVILNEKMVGRAAFRAILFVPVILQTGLIAEIDAANTLLSSMNDTSSGITTGGGAAEEAVSGVLSTDDLSWLFANLSVGSDMITYVTQLINNIYDIINRSGVQMLIFLAGLQSISPAIYESATVEGATWWESFWKITIPMISPLILVNMVYTIVDSFTNSSNSVMGDIFGRITTGAYEEASARAFVYLAFVGIIIAVVVAVVNHFVFYENK